MLIPFVHTHHDLRDWVLKCIAQFQGSAEELSPTQFVLYDSRGNERLTLVLDGSGCILANIFGDEKDCPTNTFEELCAIMQSAVSLPVFARPRRRL